MSNDRPYQVRIFLRKEFADAVNKGITPKEIQPLIDAMDRHGAAIDHNQFEEFSKFVQWADASLAKMQPSEQKDHFEKLANLTRGSLADEEKQSYFKREYTLRIGPKSQFNGPEADALIADLEKLGDGPIITSGKGFVPGKSYEVAPVRKSYVPKRHPGT